MTPAIAVVLCTFDRTDLLVRAIRSVLAGLDSAMPPVDVLVVDNGPTGHAAALVEGLQADVPPGHRLRCIRAAPPNISVARNTAISATTAPLVAFLDDDQRAEPGWLRSLLTALEAHGADIALGRVDPAFEGDAPPPDSRLWEEYSCIVDTPKPIEVAPSGPLRPPGFTFRTGNSLWRRARCFDDPAPFDRQFGAVGGEDLDLGLTLTEAGRTVVYAPDARATEWVPLHRRSARYRRLRAYAGGQCYAAITVKHSLDPASTRLRLAAIGVAQSVFWLLRAWVVGPFTSAERRADWMDRALLGWGKVTWKRMIALYHKENPETQ